MVFRCPCNRGGRGIFTVVIALRAAQRRLDAGHGEYCIRLGALRAVFGDAAKPHKPVHGVLVKNGHYYGVSYSSGTTTFVFNFYHHECAAYAHVSDIPR